MKAYNYSDARKRLSEVLDIAKNEEVLIKRRSGETFSLVLKKSVDSTCKCTTPERDEKNRT